MMPNPMGREMAAQRVAERVRRAEADRRSRPVAEFRAAARRDRIRRALTVLTPKRRARIERELELAVADGSRQVRDGRPVQSVA